MMQEQIEPHLSFKAAGETEWRALTNASTSENTEKSNEAKGKLRQTLLSSLQMQHLVVLAGSGCSLSAGGPSMKDLWDATVGATSDAKEIAEQVNHDLADKNIEAFLSQIEAFLQVKKDQKAFDFLSESKKRILEKCSAFLNSARLEAHKIFLHRLSRRRVRDERLKVFTTNYDICFERAASELGSVALDGFSFTAPRRYDPRHFGYDIVRRPRSGDDLGNYLEGVYLLYKLHGSVNWARGMDGVIQEKENPKPEEACLIYPAKGKYQQSFTQPYLESIAQFLAAVREPNTCILVVGFGFNDDHLSEPLLEAMRSNPHLRVIIVNPNAKAKSTDSNGNRYWPKFFELSKRGEDVWFVTAPFEDFAPMIPDLKSLTPADTLMKAIEGVARRR